LIEPLHSQPERERLKRVKKRMTRPMGYDQPSIAGRAGPIARLLVCRSHPLLLSWQVHRRTRYIPLLRACPALNASGRTFRYGCGPGVPGRAGRSCAASGEGFGLRLAYFPALRGRSKGRTSRRREVSRARLRCARYCAVSHALAWRLVGKRASSWVIAERASQRVKRAAGRSGPMRLSWAPSDT